MKIRKNFVQERNLKAAGASMKALEEEKSRLDQPGEEADAEAGKNPPVSSEDEEEKYSE